MERFTVPTLATATVSLTRALENKTLEVPVLPEAAQKVIQLSNDPDSDASDIARVIQSDPTLGGHVMRIANSAAYTPNSNLVSIQQAISRLGLTEINAIALSTSMSSKLFHAPAYQSHIVDIWQHALACACWSKEIARAMRANVEAAFLCGLLHSIGKPVILQTVAESLPGEKDPLEDEDLKNIFKQFQPKYALSVAKAWELPVLVTEAICYHNHFKKAPKATELAATIAFGAKLASALMTDETLNHEDFLQEPALAVINLYPDEVEKLIEKQSVVKEHISTLSSN